jgi:hypothetical protein
MTAEKISSKIFIYNCIIVLKRINFYSRDISIIVVNTTAEKIKKFE